MKIFYSPLLNGFLLESTAQEYKGKDLVEVTQDTYDKFLAGSKTQLMVPGDNGPAWADIPPPTHDELVAAAEAEKQQRIALANDFMKTLYTILCKCLFSEVTVQAVTELDNKAAHCHTPVPQRHRPFL